MPLLHRGAEADGQSSLGRDQTWGEVLLLAVYCDSHEPASTLGTVPAFETPRRTPVSVPRLPACDSRKSREGSGDELYDSLGIRGIDPQPAHGPKAWYRASSRATGIRYAKTNIH